VSTSHLARVASSNSGPGGLRASRPPHAVLVSVEPWLGGRQKSAGACAAFDFCAPRCLSRPEAHSMSRLVLDHDPGRQAAENFCGPTQVAGRRSCACRSHPSSWRRARRWPLRYQGGMIRLLSHAGALACPFLPVPSASRRPAGSLPPAPAPCRRVVCARSPSGAGTTLPVARGVTPRPAGGGCIGGARRRGPPVRSSRPGSASAFDRIGRPDSAKARRLARPLRPAPRCSWGT